MATPRSAALLVPLLLSPLLLCLAAPSRAAQDPEGWSYQAWNELMSPFCPGKTLADCPSSQADTVRRWILSQEAAGASKAEVEEQLYERFGDVILSAPRAEGFGIAAYAIPIATFLAGGLLVALFLRRQTARSGDAPVAAVPDEPADPELERLLDEELAR